MSALILSYGLGISLVIGILIAILYTEVGFTAGALATPLGFGALFGPIAAAGERVDIDGKILLVRRLMRHEVVPVDEVLKVTLGRHALWIAPSLHLRNGTKVRLSPLESVSHASASVAAVALASRLQVRAEID